MDWSRRHFVLGTVIGLGAGGVALSETTTEETTVEDDDDGEGDDDVKDVDTFDDGDLSEYSGDTDSFTVEDSGTIEDNYWLQINGTSRQYIYSYPGDGLNYYPQRGDVLELYYLGDGFGSGDPPYEESDPPYEEVPLFGVVDESNYYSIFIDGNNGRFALNKTSSAGNDTLDSERVSYPNKTWLRITIDFDSSGDGTISARLEDTDTESELAFLSGSDTEHDGRGIGYEGDVYGTTNRDRRVDRFRVV